MKNNNILRLSGALAISAFVALNTITTFAATNTAETTTKKEEFKKPENEIIGKITAIDSSKVTIAVATRKEMEKPANGEKGNFTPPEKPAEGTTGTDGKKPEKPNMDNMFNLTGDTKTINIASAKFMGGPMGMPKDKNATADTNTKETKAAETVKEKTYSDFAVGDYVSIELTDANSLVAKTVRDAGFGGFRGGKPGEKPAEKETTTK